MIIILLIPAALLLAIILGIYDEIKKTRQKKKEKQAFIKNYVAEHMRQWDAKQEELTKQLETIQYQIYLLDLEDKYIDRDFTSEQSIKKAYAMERKYANLYKKERELKRKLEEL